MMKNRKSQAALEFLMTYGWAILVVLVAIGALAYFGVLSPDRFLPNKCTMQAGIACLDFTVVPATIEVRLQNSLGYDLSSVKVGAEGCGEDTTTQPTLSNGGQATYSITCDSDPATAGNQPLIGSRYNKNLWVEFTSAESGLTHNSSGQITSKIG